MNSFTVLLKAVPARIFVFFYLFLQYTYATNTNCKSESTHKDSSVLIMMDLQ